MAPGDCSGAARLGMLALGFIRFYVVTFTPVYSGLLRFTPVWSGFESPIGRGGESTSSPRWLRGVVEQRGVPFWNLDF